jgi:hypothetical protein
MADDIGNTKELVDVLKQALGSDSVTDAPDDISLFIKTFGRRAPMPA